MSNQPNIIKQFQNLYEELKSLSDQLTIKSEIIKALREEVSTKEKRIKELEQSTPNARYKTLIDFWKSNTQWLNGCYNTFETKMYKEWEAIQTNKPTVFNNVDMKYITELKKVTVSKPTSLIPPQVMKKKPPKLVKKRTVIPPPSSLNKEWSNQEWEMFNAKTITPPPAPAASKATKWFR